MHAMEVQLNKALHQIRIQLQPISKIKGRGTTDSSDVIFITSL